MRITFYAENRMHRHVDGEAMAIDRRRNRVDQERHVLVDHFDDRERRPVSVLLF